MNLPQRAAVHAALGDERRLAVVEALALSDLSPAELATRLDLPSNLLAHHLKSLERVGLIERRDSDADGRRRYLKLRHDRLPCPPPVPALGGETVLFACSRNSARSQLAAALYRRQTGRKAFSAGSRPAPTVHSKARVAAEEVGLRLADSTHGYHEVPSPDILVTVCDFAGEDPPPFGSPVRLHWSIADPVADGRLEAFRAARSDLDRRIGWLTKALM